MGRKAKKTKQTQTGNIQIDTQKCKACWECIEVCTNNVIGRINLPWHKHARIVNGENCTGCLKCVKACEFDAVLKLQN